MVVSHSELFAASSEVIEKVTSHYIAFNKFSSNPLRDSANYGKVLEEVIKHANFPGSSEFYSVSKMEPYFQRPKYHKILSKVTYVYKKDFCMILQNIIYECPLKPLEAKFAVAMVSYYLRNVEMGIPATEMVPLNKESFFDVQMEIFYHTKKFATREWRELSPMPVRFDLMSVEEAAEYYFKIIQHHLEMSVEVKDLDNDFEDFLKLVEKFNETHPIEHHGFAYLRVMVWTAYVIKSYSKFVKEHVDAKSENSKTIVRLFNSGNEKIVLAHELLHQMKSKDLDVSAFEEKINGMPELSTLTFRQVFEMVPKESIKNIDFISIKDETLVVIPLSNGSYCYLKDGEMLPFEWMKTQGTEEYKDEEPAQQETKEIPTSAEPATEVMEKAEEATPEPADILDEEKEKTQEKRKTKKAKTLKIKKPTLKLQEVKPEEKQSESCPKCFCASLHTRKANEKLRMDKIEKKALNKKLTEMETMVEMLKKELEEKNQMIRSQMDQMEEKDEVIRSQNERLKENQEHTAKLQEQVVTKTEKIENLEATISLTSATDGQPEETTPIRSDEETEKVRDAFFKLLDIQAIYRREGPISKVLQMTNMMMAKTNSVEVRRRSRFETIRYRESCTKYTARHKYGST